MSAVVATARWRALGTSAELLVTDPAALATARAAVERRVAAIDRACSRFREDSELTLANAAAGTTVPASRTFAHAVAIALRVARATGGLVDPTLGADLRRAGYDRDFALVVAEQRSPLAAGSDGREPLDHAHARHVLPLRRLHVRRRRPQAWRAVEADELLGTVRVPAGVELDLGATAKALAADLAAIAAHAATGAGVLVALGGDVAVAGEPPAGGWIVRVGDDHATTRPQPASALRARHATGAADSNEGERESAPQQTIVLHTGGLATSGTTVRRWTVDGERRHHVIDSGTGAPAQTPWRTVSVAAGSCVDANAASTAALVHGADAPSWLAARRLPARLVSTGGEVVRVAGWPQPCAPAEAASQEPVPC